MAPFFDPKGKGKARAFPLEGLSIQEPAFVECKYHQTACLPHDVAPVVSRYRLAIEPQPSSSKVLLRATPPALVYTPSDMSSTAAMRKASESAMPPPRVPFVVVPLSRPPSPLQEVIDFSVSKPPFIKDRDLTHHSTSTILTSSSNPSAPSSASLSRPKRALRSCLPSRQLLHAQRLEVLYGCHRLSLPRRASSFFGSTSKSPDSTYTDDQPGQSQ